MSGQYVDFDLSIRLDGQRCHARVIHSPVGSSEPVQFDFPFRDRSIAELTLTLENAVLRGGGRFRGPATREETTLRDFGQTMFDCIFRDSPIAGPFTSSLAIVRQPDANPGGLRVKLRLESPELAQLPWEYLFDRTESKYLALRVESPIVRFLDVGHPPPALSVEGPLRILGMIANPGGNWDVLDAERERHRIDGAMASLIESGAVHFRWVLGETADALLDMMKQGPWHIFHFIGHGGAPTHEDGEGFVVFADEAGEPAEVTASDLMYLLDGDRSLRLVVLNCCDAARGAAKNVFGSPGAALVRAGIPTTIAMQFPITDAAATRLAAGFYGSLADNNSVERAVTDGRRKMHVQSKIEWGIPVVYTRGPSARLFTRISRGAAASTSSPGPVAPSPSPGTDPPGGARDRLRRLFNAYSEPRRDTGASHA